MSTPTSTPPPPLTPPSALIRVAYGCCCCLVENSAAFNCGDVEEGVIKLLALTEDIGLWWLVLLFRRDGDPDLVPTP